MKKQTKNLAPCTIDLNTLPGGDPDKRVRCSCGRDRIWDSPYGYGRWVHTTL